MTLQFHRFKNSDKKQWNLHKSLSESEVYISPLYFLYFLDSILTFNFQIYGLNKKEITQTLRDLHHS